MHFHQAKTQDLPVSVLETQASQPRTKIFLKRSVPEPILEQFRKRLRHESAGRFFTHLIGITSLNTCVHIVYLVRFLKSIFSGSSSIPQQACGIHVSQHACVQVHAHGRPDTNTHLTGLHLKPAGHNPAVGVKELSCVYLWPQACDPRYSVYTPPVYTSSLSCLIPLVLVKCSKTGDAVEQVSSAVLRRQIIQQVGQSRWRYFVSTGDLSHVRSN